jgi:hypothetical protein
MNLRATSFRIDAFESLPGGRVKIKGRLTKSGVFEYQRGDIKLKESRPESEVFSADSLDSLEGAFVTIDHPQVPPSGVAVGRVLSVESDPPYVNGVLQVEDSRAAKMIENGHLKELSCGYTMTLQESDSEEADFIQTNIRYDHAALLPEGRGRLGRDVCLRLDSNNDQVLYMTDSNEEQAELEEVKPDPLLARIDAIDARLDAWAAEQQPEQKAFDAKPETTSLEDLDDAVDEKVNKILGWELRARDSFSAVFPKHTPRPKICAKELCEAVIQHVDRSFEASEDFDIEDLVARAELVARTARMDSAQPTPSQLRDALLTGTPPKSESNGLRSKILNKELTG